MPSIKKSIMISDKSQAYIVCRFRKEDAQDVFSWSQGINGAVSTLQFILANSLPELTEYEWECVLNTFNGTMWDDERIESFLSIASRMMDNIGAVDINEVEENYANAVRKMHALTAVEQYAVADMCRKFWSDSHKESTMAEIIDSLKGI